MAIRFEHIYASCRRERIENLSLGDSLVLLTIDVTVGYDTDVDQVCPLLVDAALHVDRVQRDPAPAARLVRLGADGLEFQLLFWIDDPEDGQLNVRSDVNLSVLKALRAAGIEIPFPQREVRMRAPGNGSRPAAG